MKTLSSRNHAATTRRGLITPQTTRREFILKIYEEVKELTEAIPGTPHEAEELADVILVCLCYAAQFNIDIDKAMKKKVTYNETRP
jgi:NTP pyrophosphatase (non-canonical NTP hydrolase)